MLWCHTLGSSPRVRRGSVRCENDAQRTWKTALVSNSETPQFNLLSIPFFKMSREQIAKRSRRTNIRSKSSSFSSPAILLLAGRPAKLERALSKSIRKQKTLWIFQQQHCEQTQKKRWRGSGGGGGVPGGTTQPTMRSQERGRLDSKEIHALCL